MKKLVAILLLLAMICSYFVSCKKDKNQKDNTVGGDTQNAVSLGEGVLPDAKAEYVDRQFNILYRDSYKYEWEFNEADAGAHINDAIYKRNTAVEDRYQIELVYYPVVSNVVNAFDDNFMAPIQTAVLTNENAYQLAAGYEYQLAYNSVLGNFLDWYQVPNVDMDGDWWDRNFAEAATYQNQVYIMTGSLSLSHLYSSSCVFFNEDLVNSRIDNGSAELFGKVESGEWTLETFETYVKMFTLDDDGIEGMTEDDSYGFATNDSTAVDAFVLCSNIAISGRDSEGNIKLYNVNEKLINLASTLNRIMHTSGDTYVQDGRVEALDHHIGMMMRGKTAFTTSHLERAVKLRTTEVNYGILPYPKYDENQKNYYSVTMDFSTAFTIPKTESGDLDFVGTITEALAFYSYHYVRDALYNTVLKFRDAKDANSSKCVDIILENPKYDFATIYAFAWGDVQGPSMLLRNCLRSKTDAISVLFDSLKDGYNTKLGVFLNHFE